MDPGFEYDQGAVDTLAYDLQLKLDLHNFEDPRYEDSKYILTSPRSLESCCRLEIKPVELLYKPLAEFQEELLPQDVPLRTIFNIYDDHEQDRQKKLHRCREERRNIIEEDIGRDCTSVTVSRHQYHDPAEDEGRVQRERTKWVSSIGHQRVSRQELDQRAKKLYEDSIKAQTACSSISAQKKKRSRKGNNSVSRDQSANSSRLSQQSRLNYSNNSSLKLQSDARPLTNPKLRRSLQGSAMVNKEIPKRDQKILELMMSKGEEEKKFYEDRQAAKLVWDEERKRQVASQNEAENQRRKLLSQDRQEWQSQREEKMMEQSRLDETVRGEREKNIENKLRQSETLIEQSLRAKILQIEEKKMKDSLRKNNQEKNRVALESDEAEMRDLVKERQRQELEEAYLRKEAKLIQESQRKRLKNYQKDEEHQLRKKHLDTADSRETENLRSSIDSKHAKAVAKYEEVLNRRDLQLRLSQRDREKKHHVVKLNQKHQDSEMEEWRLSLCEYRQSLLGRASEAVNRTNQLKVEKAARDRREKQRLQKVNIKKVAEDLESWRRSTHNLLEEKQRKIQDMQQEKELNTNQTRAMAHTSECMRDELRRKYAKDSFDKEAKKVEIFNRMGLGLLGKADFGKRRPQVKFSTLKINK